MRHGLSAWVNLALWKEVLITKSRPAFRRDMGEAAIIH